MKLGTVFSDGREGSTAHLGGHTGQLQSNLQKHMANTGQLLRSRSNTKRQNIESLAHNHSVRFLNRPMMNNLMQQHNLTYFAPPAQNASALGHCPSALSQQPTTPQYAANRSAGPLMQPQQQPQKRENTNLPRMLQR